MPETLQVTQITTPPDVIDLGRGDPQLALLPLEVLRRAAEHRLNQEENAFLQYGIEQGDGYLRVALAAFLSEGYGFNVNPESLFITAGISSALDLICMLFTQSGDTVFVEEPTYFLALRIFADHGLRVVSIPTDESGLVVDALDEALKHHRPKFVYTIPVFQNPTGHTLAEERRQVLLALTRGHDLLLLADEVYQLLHYTVAPPRSFGAYAADEHVISLGSFSKILAPGLRLGWIQAHASVIKRLAGCGLLDSGGGMNPFTSAILRSIVADGDLKRNIARLVQVYASRVRAMDAALRKHLPQAGFVTPNGGYFFWLRLAGIDTVQMRQLASAQKVDFRPGKLFSSQDGLREYLRLGISYYDAGDLEQGVLRLAECVAAVR